MRKGSGWLFGLLAIGAVAHAQQTAPGHAAADPATRLDKSKLSYAIGYQIGSQFADGDPAVDLPMLQKAIQDAYAKRTPAVPMAEMRGQLQALDRQMHARAVAEFEHIAQVNARKSQQYMDKNRRQPGVVQLPSGVQYSVIEKGKGSQNPGIESRVTVNYRGMLVDGTEFDSTYAHGQPATMTVKSMIPGWRDVFPRMHVGDRWRVVIPPRLAYGERGMLPRIGPNETLVFDIQLLKIVDP